MARKNPDPTKKAGRGRPKFDLESHAEEIRKMAGVGCTNEEIGIILGCSADTLERAARDPDGPIFAALSKGRAQKKMQLRARLYSQAMTSTNPAPLIFACKTQLGMSEKITVENTGTGSTSFAPPALSPDAIKAIEKWAKHAATHPDAG